MKKIWCSDAEKMQPGMERAEHFKNCDECKQRHKETWDKKEQKKIEKEKKKEKEEEFKTEGHLRRRGGVCLGVRDEDEIDDR